MTGHICLVNYLFFVTGQLTLPRAKTAYGDRSLAVNGPSGTLYPPNFTLQM